MSTYHLDHLFAPESVAVVGRFHTRKDKTRAVLENLLQDRSRSVHVIDLDGTDRPQGLAEQVAWCSGWDDGRINASLLLSMLPFSETRSVLTRAPNLGVRNLVIFGRPAARDQATQVAEVQDMARAAGIRLLGPGSFGVVCPGEGLNGSLFEAPVVPGNIALISQSGSLISTILDMAALRNLGFSHVLSLGSQIDVDFGDVIDYLAWDAREYQVATFAPAARPAERFELESIAVRPSSTALEGVNVFVARSAPFDPPEHLTPGMEGVVHIDAGARPVWWVFTHRFTDWLRLNFWW